MFTGPIRDVVRAVGSDKPRVFTSSQEVDDVSLAVTAGLCRLVHEPEQAMLHQTTGWPGDCGILLTERGRQEYREILEVDLSQEKRLEAV